MPQGYQAWGLTRAVDSQMTLLIINGSSKCLTRETLKGLRLQSFLRDPPEAPEGLVTCCKVMVFRFRV